MKTPTPEAERRERAFDIGRLDAHRAIPRRTEIHPRAAYLEGYEAALSIYEHHPPAGRPRNGR